MNNKVLIKLDIPHLDKSFDLFIPVNEVIWKITSLVGKSSLELMGYMGNPNTKYIFINKKTNEIYSANSTIYESNIRNGTELVMLQI